MLKFYIPGVTAKRKESDARYNDRNDDCMHSQPRISIPCVPDHQHSPVPGVRKVGQFPADRPHKGLKLILGNSTYPVFFNTSHTLRYVYTVLQ